MPNNKRNFVRNKELKQIRIFPLENFSKSHKISISPSNLKSLKNSKKFQRRTSDRKKTCGKTINFIRQISLLIKIANLMKFRTKFRTLNNISKEKIELLNDISYFPEKKEKYHFLKRFTQKNVKNFEFFLYYVFYPIKKRIKRAYYQFMSWLSSNDILNSCLCTIKIFLFIKKMNFLTKIN